MQENIPLEEVFENLHANRRSCASLEEKKEISFLKFLRFKWNPLSWVMEVAAIMEE
jgi:hypothetical protein